MFREFAVATYKIGRSHALCEINMNFQKESA